MPTQRFFNLKEEKRRAILTAAIHEFTRVPYASASINQIIKEADISRGSFYTYFEDKDDLIRYILEGIRKKYQERIFQLMEEEKGCYFRVPIRLLEQVMERGEGSVHYKLFKSLLSDMSAVDQNQLFGVKGFLLEDEAYQTFVSRIYQHMDKESCPVRMDMLIYGVEMTMMVLIKALSLYYKNTTDKDKILTAARNELLILERGVLDHGIPAHKVLNQIPS